MAIAFDAFLNGSAFQVTSLTLTNFTCSGADRYMFIRNTNRGDTTRTITGVTFNGDALTFIRRDDFSFNFAERGEVWDLINPDAATGNVVITFDGTTSNECQAVAVSYTGVHQTTARGSAGFASGFNPTITQNVSSATDEVVVDAAWSLSAANTPTVGASQTERYNASEGSRRTYGSDEPGAATVTMSWSNLVNGSDHMQWAWALKPASAPPVEAGRAGGGRRFVSWFNAP